MALNLQLYTDIIKELDVVITKYAPAKPMQIRGAFEDLVTRHNRILEQESAAQDEFGVDVAATRLPSKPVIRMYAKEAPSVQTKAARAEVEEQKTEANHDLVPFFSLEETTNEEQHLTAAESDYEDDVTYAPKIGAPFEDQKRLIFEKLNTMRRKIEAERQLISEKQKNEQRVQPTDCKYLYPIPTLNDDNFNKDLKELDALIKAAIAKIPLSGRHSKSQTQEYVADCLKLIKILAKHKKQLMPAPPAPMLTQAYMAASGPRRSSRATTGSTASIKCKNLSRSCTIS